MASVILLQITFIYNKHKSNKDAFIIFHKSRSSILGFHKINQPSIHHNLDPTNISQEKLLQNYAVENFVSKIEEASIKDLYMINDKPLLIVDSLGVYNVPKFKPHYILLRNSPKINLKRLIDSIHPKYIIADGSNYKSYIETWEATCQKEKLPFHHTGKKGAFIITD
ncbi:hypothetical protein [Mangrovimonas sp. DI 80]|uniref:hypothetical protein n=1 Tax=Mangrovimonas sp. DI 80 TaxID=1779330 RepID=UPI0009F9D712|nr:hypothetical protein [Mangrovimonas sp. DI 80]